MKKHLVNKLLVLAIIVLMVTMVAKTVYSYTIILDSFKLQNIVLIRVVTVDPETEAETVEWKIGANYTIFSAADPSKSMGDNKTGALTEAQATAWENFIKPRLAALKAELETPLGEDWVNE